MAPSVHRRQPGDRNAPGAATPRVQHPPRVLRATRVGIGLQQREFDEIELGAAAADALEFAGNWFERFDRGGKITPFESRKSVCCRWHQRTRRIAALVRQLGYLPRPGIELGGV